MPEHPSEGEKRASEGDMRGQDEISLRELYLIFRAGFRLIVAVALLAGVAAFLLIGLRGSVYRAGATVQVMPPQIGASASGSLQLSTPVGLDMDSYRAIAESREVLGTVADLEEVSMTAEQLAEVGQLISVGGTQLPRGQLVVRHEVTSSDPKAAADVANAWASTSARGANLAMTSALSVSIRIAEAEIAKRLATLQQATEAWTSFLAVDRRASLSSSLGALSSLDSSRRVRLSTLEASLAAKAAQQQALLAVLDGRGVGTAAPSTDLSAQLNHLIDLGLLSEPVAASLLQALAALPAGATTSEQDLLTLATRSQLESVMVAMAGEAAEVDQIRAGLPGIEEQAAEIRLALAELEGRAATLQRELSLAQADYDRAAPGLPALELQRDLVEMAARVVVSAAEPLLPEPRNRLVLTAAAILVAGLLATLFVFMRQAVRGP